VNYVWIEQKLQSFVDAIDSYSGRVVNGQGQIAVPSVTEEELLQRSAATKKVVDAVHLARLGSLRSGATPTPSTTSARPHWRHSA